MTITNAKNAVNSLQVSVIGNIPSGDFDIDRPFLIKNISTKEIFVTIKPLHQKDPIETVIYPGWNPEICDAVYGASEGQLQYGY